MISHTWLHPWAFWLFLLLPLAGWIGWIARKRTPRLRHPGLPSGFRPRAGLRRRLSSLPLWIRILALASLVTGLARPVYRSPWSEDTVNGVDIVLVLDVSTSMQIHDVEPNRMEAAREMMVKFIAARDRDRMALVAFAGRPVTRCPLTSDREVLRALLDSTSNQGLEDGTAIGDALLMAGNRLRNSPAKSKVVVLLTDGQNNMGTTDPASAARALAAMGIKIHTIGLGTEGVFTQDFVLGNGATQKLSMQSSLDAKSLAELARLGHGSFFRAADRGSLQEAYAKIDELEKTRITTTMHWETWELFSRWVWLAMALVVVAWTLERTWLRRTP